MAQFTYTQSQPDIGASKNMKMSGDYKMNQMAPAVSAMPKPKKRVTIGSIARVRKPKASPMGVFDPKGGV